MLDTLVAGDRGATITQEHTYISPAPPYFDKKEIKCLNI